MSGHVDHLRSTVATLQQQLAEVQKEIEALAVKEDKTIVLLDEADENTEVMIEHVSASTTADLVQPLLVPDSVVLDYRHPWDPPLTRPRFRPLRRAFGVLLLLMVGCVYLLVLSHGTLLSLVTVP